MDLDFVSIHKHAKKERGQYPAILTSRLVDREFKVYDATATKTSFKIATSGSFIFFVIMLACLTSRTELGSKVMKLRQKIQIRCLVFTFSEKLDNW